MGEATQRSVIGLVSLAKGIQEATKEMVEDDFISEMPKTTISSSDSKLTRQLVCVF